MDWEVGFALLLTAFCVVAPTLLYVGLVRGLERLRDDPFVEQMLLQAEEYESGDGGGTTDAAWRAFAPSSSVTESTRPGVRDGGGPSAVDNGPVCPRCGAPNAKYTRFCGVCLAEISE